MPDGPIDEWRRLRVDGRGDGKLSVPTLSTGIETGYGPALYATGPAGEPRLLVPCSQGRGSGDLGSSPNLVARRTSFQVDGRNMAFLDSMVLDRRLDAVFADLVREILARLGAGHSPDLAVSGTIADFRQLLLAAPPRDVSIETVIGLLGELAILERLSAFTPEAVTAWMGPLDQRQDFRSGSRAIEVKSSLRSDAKRITIHGPDQLSPPNSGLLHLAHVRLERAEGGSLTVAGLCRAILGHGADSLRLSERLGELGCTDPDAAEWNTSECELEGIDLYRVAPGFPRITADQFVSGRFPEGVDGLCYRVDLDLASQFRLTAEDRQEVLKGFCK